MGILGAITSQIFLGYFVEWLGQLGYTGPARWNPAFYIYGGLLLVGATGWTAINPHRSLIESQEKTP
jgi:hypothetical protein